MKLTNKSLPPVVHKPIGATPTFARLVVVALVLGCVLSLFFWVCPAHADDRTNLNVGSVIYYDGWSTNYMNADGNVAYCANPSMATPANGSYAKTAIVPLQNPGRASEVAADLYFGFGGPGFDKNMWPKTWYDGSAMTDDRYSALTHILISDTYATDGSAAMFGCSYAFRNWCAQNIIGISQDGLGTLINASATGRLIWQRHEEVPSSFHAFALHTGSATQTIVSFTYTPEGDFELIKASSNSELTEGDNRYSLEGAEYGVYTDNECNEYVGSITTDKNGYAKTAKLLERTYYVKELKASKGYALDNTIYQADVKGGTTIKINAKEPPLPGYFDLQKKSTNPEISNGNTLYTLEGAIYTVFSDAACTASVTSLTTDKSGYAKSDAIPAGHYFIKETKPTNSGFWIEEGEKNARVYPITIGGNTTERLNTQTGGTLLETPQSHPLSLIVSKVDSATNYLDSTTGLKHTQGGATLAGAQFNVRYFDGYFNTVEAAEASGEPLRTWIVQTDKDGHAKLEDAYRIGGDPYYRDKNNCIVIPLGTLLIQETKAPQGYILNDQQVHLRQLKEREYANDVILYNAPEHPNDVKRGDIELTKERASNQNRLPYIPFKITCTNTGESHLIVTDSNGEAKTTSSWNPHTQKTNANDNALNPDGTVDEEKLDPEAGIWFDEETISDNRGALPYGHYRLEELRTSQNAGYEMVALDFDITKNGYCIPFHLNNDNENTPAIKTAARDKEDGDKTVTACSQATIIDRIEYYNFDPEAKETYTCKASLIDAETELPLVGTDGQPLIATKSFIPQSTMGYVEVELFANTLNYAGKTVVVFEEVFDSKGTLICKHKDSTDYDQSINVIAPEITTEAYDSTDNDKTLCAESGATLTDKISYRGLKPGEEYELRGSLHKVLSQNSSEENSEDSIDPTLTSEPLLDKQGMPLGATTTFIPNEADGSVELTFTFDGTGLGENNLVVFEELYLQNIKIAEHMDAEDPNQTTYLITPTIHTSAQDKTDKDKLISAGKRTTLIDTVTYNNLTVGREYRLEGTLNKVTETGAEVLLGKDGLPISATTSFIPQTSEGEVAVNFAFDSSALDDHSLVVFETLFQGESIIAEHTDPTDQNQTVKVQSLEFISEAKSVKGGNKKLIADGNAQIIDHISYTNAEVGTPYTLFGLLIDGNSGLPILNYIENDNVSEKELSNFMLEYGSALGYFASPIADTKNAGELNTQNNESKEADNLLSAYSSSLPLPIEANSEEIKQVLEAYPNIASRLVQASTTFTPETSSGSTSMTYSFDARDLEDKTIVSSAWVKDNEDTTIAVENNPNIDEQSVLTVKPALGTVARDEADGDNIIYNSNDATIIDEVSFSNLEPGTEYTLSGILYDKATELPLVIKDKTVESTHTFTAETESGKTEVSFNFDATDLENHNLVVFEYLTRKEVNEETIKVIEVAKHEDINASKQTISVKAIEPGEPFAKTGSTLLSLFPIFGIAILLLALLSYFGNEILRRNQRKLMSRTLHNSINTNW